VIVSILPLPKEASCEKQLASFVFYATISLISLLQDGKKIVGKIGRMAQFEGYAAEKIQFSGAIFL
jgi:hypothetical protein